MMRFRHSVRSAFTVLEMMITCALLSVISLLLFQALDNVSRITSRFQSKGMIYQDTRVVIDQLSRELQQAVPYSGPPAIFRAKSGATAELHFIALIDNNKGQDEAEVHYLYNDSKGELTKSIVFYDADSTGYWDIIDNPTLWMDSPTKLAGGKYGYHTILDGIDSIKFQMWDAYPAGGNFSLGFITDTDVASEAEIPAYMEVTIVMFDREVWRKYKGNPTAIVGNDALLKQEFKFFVQLPLSHH
jgi:hypothetical protein